MIEKPTEHQSQLTVVSLVNAQTASAIGQVSVSWWRDQVRAGRAPQPAIRSNRFTRWRASDVAEFWRTCAELGSAQGETFTRQAKAESLEQPTV